MKQETLIGKLKTAGLGLALGVTIGLLLTSSIIQIASAQGMALHRERGTIFDYGEFHDFTAGATITANQALYLDSTGKVQPLSSGQDTNFIGIAYNGVASGSTVHVQTSGIATVSCSGEGNVAINDKVGGTSLVTAGTLKTLSSTLAATITTLTGKLTANGTGGATVTAGTSSGTEPVITLDSSAVSVTGSGTAARSAGRALTACTDPGTFTVLLSK